MPKKRTFKENYATYDTSEGFGNPEQWRQAFNARLSNTEIDNILNGQSPHSVLETTETASHEEIKSAYRRLCLRYHPDKNHDPSAVNKFRQIQAAYERLTI